MILPQHHRPRRRSRFGVHLCAAVAAVFLLMFSVVVLHNRLGLLRQHHSSTLVLDHESLADDSISDLDSGSDRIDELDIVDEDQMVDRVRGSDAKEIMTGGAVIDSGYDDGRSRVSRFYFDQFAGVIRLPFDRKSVDMWDDDRAGLDLDLGLGLGEDDRSKVAVASDDVPVEEEVRKKMDEVRTVEDALLLNIGNGGNPLREGWGAWFDKKGDFLRRDRMFKSDFDLIDPLNNPLLHDPDAVVVTGLTKGDKLVQKLLMNEMKNTPFDFKQNHLKKKSSNDDEILGRK